VASAPFWIAAALFGVRHVFEPDHLAAISALVSSEKSARKAVGLGAAWGVGHAAALLLVASVLALAETAMPAALAGAFEVGAALVLIVLGARTIVRAAVDARRGEPRPHRHGLLAHAHPDPPGGHLHVGARTFARRSLMVGVLHGLAGSGSLVALAAARLPSTPARLGYVAVVGAGAVAGMAVLSGLAGVPLARMARLPRVRHLVSLGVGAFALVLGAVWWWNGVRVLVG
jgi:hypothetical protein